MAEEEGFTRLGMVADGEFTSIFGTFPPFGSVSSVTELTYFMLKHNFVARESCHS